MTPVRIPGAAAGSTTLQVVRHRGAPSASAASFWASGTSRRISSEERTTIGNITSAEGDPARERREVAHRDHDAEVDDEAGDDRGHAEQHVDDEADARAGPSGDRPPVAAASLTKSATRIPSGAEKSVASPIRMSVPDEGVRDAAGRVGVGRAAAR